MLRLLVFIGRAGWGESEKKEDKDYGGTRGKIRQGIAGMRDMWRTEMKIKT